MKDQTALDYTPSVNYDEARAFREQDAYEASIRAELNEIAPIRRVTDYDTDRASELELQRMFEDDARDYELWLERL